MKTLLTLAALSWAALAGAFVEGGEEDRDLISFEDPLLVLTRVSENVTLGQLSFKGIRCQERVRMTELDKKGKVLQRREELYLYQARRRPERLAHGHPGFSVQRTLWGSSQSQDFVLLDHPLLDQPFTGFLIQTFSLQNRIANDFAPLRNEKLGEKTCAVLAFETTPQISEMKIDIQGRQVPLRQRGMVWIDIASFQLVRIAARQTKLPKGVRSYSYQADFGAPAAFRGKLQLPQRTLLEVGLKGKSYRVEQSFEKIEPL